MLPNPQEEPAAEVERGAKLLAMLPPQGDDSALANLKLNPGAAVAPPSLTSLCSVGAFSLTTPDTHQAPRNEAQAVIAARTERAPLAVMREAGANMHNFEALPTPQSGIACDFPAVPPAVLEMQKNQIYNAELQAARDRSAASVAAVSEVADVPHSSAFLAGNIPIGTTDEEAMKICEIELHKQIHKQAPDAAKPRTLHEHEIAGLEEYELATGRNISIQELEETTEGADYWCTLRLDLKAGSALDAEFKRALKWDEIAAEQYEACPQGKKLAFKKQWAVKKKFEFCKTRRRYTSRSASATVMQGEFLTVFAIANKLGGWQIPQCRAGAIQYCLECIKRFPDVMVNNNSWSKMKLFMWIASLMTDTSEEAWANEVEQYTEEQDSVHSLKPFDCPTPLPVAICRRGSMHYVVS